MSMEIEEISLFLQIFLLAFLLIGNFFFRVKDLKRHGQILTLATAIHIPTIILRMIPAFSSDPEFTKLTLDPLDLIHWGHVALGLLAPVLGVYISLRWMMHRYDSQFCKGKWLMRITFASWLVSLLFGIIMHLSE